MIIIQYFGLTPSGADSVYNWDSGRYEDEDGNEVSWNDVQNEYGINQDPKPKFKININNPEGIEGTHVSLKGEVTFGVQFREGVKFLGVGEKIDAGVHKVVADAELLWSSGSGFILNISLPKNIQEFLDQDHEFRFGYSNLGFGSEISGSYNGGNISDIESTSHLGPVNLTLSSQSKHNLGFEILSGSHTIGHFSFTGALAVNNINLGMRTGSAADGMALSKTARDGYLRIMQHNRVSNDGSNEKHRARLQFYQALKKIKK